MGLKKEVEELKLRILELEKKVESLSSDKNKIETMKQNKTIKIFNSLFGTEEEGEGNGNTETN